MLMPHTHRDRFPSGITRAANVDVFEKKKLKGFKQGRIDVRKEVRRQQRLLNNLQRGVFRKLTSLLPKHIKAQAKIFSETGEFSRSQSYRKLENQLLSVMYQHYRRVFITVFKDNESRYEKINKSIDVSIFGRNKDIEDLVSIYNNDRTLYLANMGRSVTNNVQKIVTNGRESGASVSQIAKNIRQTAPIARRRAAAIARTETHNALSFANHEYHGVVSQEYSVKMMKKWASTSDMRTRSAHSYANGQVRDMDEPFIVGGAKMMHTGDPNGGAANVVNCRCVVLYIDADELSEAVDSKAPSIKPVNDFGKQHVKEIKPNRASFKGEELVSSVIARGSPLNELTTNNKRGCFFSHKGIINMSGYKEGSASYNSIWRHEKGHAIDYDDKLITLMQTYRPKVVSQDHLGILQASLDTAMKRRFENMINANILGASEVSASYHSRFGLSSYMAKQMVDDKKLLLKRKKVVTKRARTTMENQDYFSSNLKKLQVMGNPVIQERTIIINGKMAIQKSQVTKYSTTLTQTQFIKKWRTELDKSSSVLKYDDLKVLYGDDFLKKIFSGNASMNLNDSVNWLTYLKYNNLGTKNWTRSNFQYFLAKGNASSATKDIANFSDLIGSITNNNVMHGHTTGYYKRYPNIFKGFTDGHLTETFANFTCLLGSKNSRVWRKVLEHHVPDSLREYDKILNHLAKTKGMDRFELSDALYAKIKERK